MLVHISRILITASLIICSIAISAEPNKSQQGEPSSKQTTAEKEAATKDIVNPKIVLQTSMGEMTVELFQDKAPESVKNFLKYVDKGFYDGVIFHRIIPNFMVQTGGFSQEYRKKKTSAPIINESSNGLKNLRGTLSMARTNHPDSATAQFFINLKNNPDLDFTEGRIGMPNKQGYAVFGKVIKGLEAIDKMAEQPQGKHRSRGYGTFVNAPNKMITIDKAFREAANIKQEVEKK